MPGFGSLEPCVGNSLFRISSKRNLEVQEHITLMQRYIIQSTSYVTIEGFFFLDSLQQQVPNKDTVVFKGAFIYSNNIKEFPQ